MAKKTVLEEVKARMKEMRDKKAEQLETIRKKQAEASTQIEAAALAMRQATEEMNVEEYEKARNTKNKAQTALDMYNGRYDQIRAQEYISEEESDKVIDSLLQYEKTLDKEFKAAIAEPLRKLADLEKAYREEVADTEQTIKAWTGNIHANYRSRGGSKTHREDKPVPVHYVPYTGCQEAFPLREYLTKAAGLINK